MRIIIYEKYEKPNDYLNLTPEEKVKFLEDYCLDFIQKGDTLAFLHLVYSARKDRLQEDYVLSVLTHGKLLEKIEDLSGLSREMPLVAGALSVSLFSLAGIPPLAGFMAKFSVFVSVIESGHYLLAVVGVLTSVVTAAYYLRVVKIMYFDPPLEGTTPLDPRVYKETTFIMVGSLIFMVSFLLYPDLLMEPANHAAQTLLYRS